jgi:hypothetical protein
MTIPIDFSWQHFLDMHVNTFTQGEQFPFYIYHILIFYLHILNISIYFSILVFTNLYLFLESNFWIYLQLLLFVGCEMRLLSLLSSLLLRCIFIAFLDLSDLHPISRDYLTEDELIVQFDRKLYAWIRMISVRIKSGFE